MVDISTLVNVKTRRNQFTSCQNLRIDQFQYRIESGQMVLSIMSLAADTVIYNETILNDSNQYSRYSIQINIKVLLKEI